MENNREEKKQKFTQPPQNRTVLYSSIFGILTVLVVITSYFLWANSSSSTSSIKASADIGKAVNYNPNDQLEQTVVESKVENGKEVVITLSRLKNEKFIRTDYKANNKIVPLTAFVQPNGKVMVAVSYCEPCKSISFHITGKEIICNACGTTWDLQTLKGISGACQDYPPQALSYTLNGDSIEIPQTVLDAWVPRV